jgi:UBX domain-containing protein 1/4
VQRAPQVAPCVDESLVEALLGMGFARNRCVRAAYHSGAGGSVEAAVGWLEAHEGDADIDDPLLVPVRS